MKKLSGPALYLFFPLAMLAVCWGIMSCKSQKNPSPSTHSIFQNNGNNKSNPPQDSLVLIRNTYTLLVPNSFYIQAGLGDDSEFCKLTSSDDALVLEYETSRVRKEEEGRLEKIEEKYEHIRKLESQSGLSVLLAYDFIQVRFRDISGKVFVKEDQVYKEILLLSTNEKKLPLTQDILKTLALP